MAGFMEQKEKKISCIYYIYKDLDNGNYEQSCYLDDILEHLPHQWLNSKLAKMDIYKIEMRKEKDVKEASLVTGIVGLGAALLSALTPEDTVSDLFGVSKEQARHMKAGGLGIGATLATGSLIAGSTSEHFIFHAMVIFKLSNGRWLSIEKHNGIMIMVSNRKDNLLKFRIETRGNLETRRPHELLVTSPVKYNKTTSSLFAWLKATKPLDDGYNFFSSNCQHFAYEIFNEFGDGSVEYPGYVDRVTEDIRKTQKQLEYGQYPYQYT